MTAVPAIRNVCAMLSWSFFLFAFVVASHSYSRAQNTESALAPIASALQNKEFGKAIELLRPALQASPENLQLWTMQGAAYAGLGKTTEALASFRSALKISPDHIPALQGEAQIEYTAGSAAAIPVLRHLLRLRPEDRTSQAMLAVLEYQQGDCASAASHFEKAGALFDSQVEALHAYAACLVKLRQFEHAASVFQRAAALKPGDRHEQQLLASIQLMAHQPKEAIATLVPLLEADNSDAATLELASAAYEDAGDTAQAVDALRKAILADPRNVNLYLDFANLSSRHQSFQVGIGVVNDGLSEQPGAAPLYFARGVLYIQSAQYDHAQADFEKAYELDPNQSLSVAAQGLAAVNANDLDRALTTVRAELQRKPNDPVRLYLEADVLTRKGAGPGTPEFQQAMRAATKAVSLRPALGPAHAVLAKLYLQAGQDQQAAGQCRKALEIDPKDQTSLYRLIQALRKTRNNTEIPDLLKRLAVLRQQAAKEEKERYRYRLVEGDAAQ
jgi:tetratricopeptide (TPR) repeat protein